jgi:OmpA-OmpF porin, OOP family
MKTPGILFMLVAFFLFAGNAGAQIDVKGKIKDAVNNRANNHVDNAIDKGLDAAEKGVTDAVTGNDEESTNADEEAANNEDQQVSDDQDSDKSTEIKSQTKQDKVSIQSFTKYDFVPGDKVLFYEDFSQDAIGDFPAQWNTNASGEVKTINIAPGNWLHMNAEAGAYTPLSEIQMPENFICEFDIITTAREGEDHFDGEFLFFHADGEDFNFDEIYPGNNGVKIQFNQENWYVTGYSIDKDFKEGHSNISPITKDELHHIIIWVQKTRLRIYHQGQKAVDLPMVMYNPANFNHFRFSLWGCSGEPYVSNMRITTAGSDTRSKLLTEGKLVSYGIYFDVNKDVVKPESYGTLNDIAKILNENPDVRVKIIGYTDSDGADAANLDLSKGRGGSVKNELVKTFGIDASRLESDGKGEANPIAPNDTPANKSLNRRVEFIKL